MPGITKTLPKTDKPVLAEAKRKSRRPWVHTLERFGFVIRGVIYIVIGLLALLLAIGAGGAATNPTSAIALIGRQPFGKVFLVVIGVGLAGYSLWGFVRAIWDPLGRGTGPKGVVDRIGFFFSGISYIVLLIPTVLTLLGIADKLPEGITIGLPTAWTTGPLGKWLVILYGLVWIGLGSIQWVVAYSARFLRDLRTARMGAREIKIATWMGRIGYAARGIVIVLVGVIILQTILMIGTQQGQGFDGALAALAHAPYGELLLGAVAVGLILFGGYSSMCARWSQIGRRPPA